MQPKLLLTTAFNKHGNMQDFVIMEHMIYFKSSKTIEVYARFYKLNRKIYETNTFYCVWTLFMT